MTMTLLLIALACAPKTMVPEATPLQLVTDEAHPQDLEEAAADEVEALSEEAPPATAPTPYTAEQIRDTYVLGLVIRWQTTNHATESTTSSEWEVTAWSEEGAENTAWELGEHGVRKGEGDAGSATWEELRSHAAFPVAHTKVVETELDTPLGSLPGTRYTVVRDPLEGRVDVFEFAEAFPGPPVRITAYLGPEPLYTMVQVERRGPE